MHTQVSIMLKSFEGVAKVLCFDALWQNSVVRFWFALLQVTMTVKKQKKVDKVSIRHLKWKVTYAYVICIYFE